MADGDEALDGGTTRRSDSIPKPFREPHPRRRPPWRPEGDPDGYRRPRSPVFDVMIGVAAASMVGLGVLVSTGYFDVSTTYEDIPVPHRSTARNRCQSLVLKKLPDDADVAFSDENSAERLGPDRSWVVRGPIQVQEGNGDGRKGEYVCDHLRELPPGSDHWSADEVLVLGV